MAAQQVSTNDLERELRILVDKADLATSTVGSIFKEVCDFSFIFLFTKCFSVAFVVYQINTFSLKQ
jgi:hypothetical protein